MAIGAVIFDFNGVLVDDEAVHFALFREVLTGEGVIITERDYHERYLGYDDRGCFAAALVDAGQPAESRRLDQLIARKARRYIEVAEQGLRFSRRPPSRSWPSPRSGRWRSARGRCGPRSSTPWDDWAASIASQRSSRPRTRTSANPTRKAIDWPWLP
jgi:hypothetical protein